jgi:hypothetical protein
VNRAVGVYLGAALQADDETGHPVVRAAPADLPVPVSEPDDLGIVAAFIAGAAR